MTRLFFAMALVVVACGSEANRPAPAPRRTTPPSSTTTTTRLGVICDLGNGSQVNTGPDEAAAMHLRCAP